MLQGLHDFELLHKRVTNKLLEYRNVNLLKLVVADARWVPSLLLCAVP